MRSSLEIQEVIDTLIVEAEALNATAKKEERDLTEAEQSRSSAIMAKETGEVAVLQAELATAKTREDEQPRLADMIAGYTTVAAGDGASLAVDVSATNVVPSVRAAGITIPAQCRHRLGSLKAFKGDHAEQSAYLSGRFLLANIFGHESSQQWCRDNGINAALTTGDNTLGGALVPAEFEQSIIDLREEYGVFRANSFVTLMAGDTKTQARRTAGLTAYAVGDNTAMTESDKNWDQIQLVAKKFGILSKYSSEIAEDAVISIADDLASEIAYAFAVKEDACGFLGDGASTYSGIVGLANALLAGSIKDAASGNVSFETLDLADFEACVGALPSYPGISPRWYIHKTGAWASMFNLANAAGGNTSANFTDGPGGGMFLGYPVVYSSTLNSTLGSDASAIKAYFGDLSMGTTLGDRRGVRIGVSDQRYFENDQIGIKGTTRLDINVHDTGTATAAGSVVALKPAAS